MENGGGSRPGDAFNEANLRSIQGENRRSCDLAPGDGGDVISKQSVRSRARTKPVAGVALMGGGVVTAALIAGLVDELALHQVPILLGGGRPFFQALPEHVRLNLVQAITAPGVTHLHYEVVR